MEKVRMIAPAGMSGMSVQGVEITPVDGVVEVEHGLARELQSHGFLYEEAQPIENSRSAHVTRMVRDTRTVCEGLADAELMDFAGLSDDDRAAFYTDLATSYKKWPAVIASRRRKESTKLPSDDDDDKKSKK